MSSAWERRAYILTVLSGYLELPETPTRARPPDRRLAGQLYDRGVPIATVQDAFLLGAARRLIRPDDAPPLSPVRSLYYFLPVVEELLRSPLPHGYAQYLASKLSRFHKSQGGNSQWRKR